MRKPRKRDGLFRGPEGREHDSDQGRSPMSKIKMKSKMRKRIKSKMKSKIMSHSFRVRSLSYS